MLFFRALLLSAAISISAIAAPAILPKSPLFAVPSILSLDLKGAFQKVKEANGDGNWDDEDRSDPKYWSDMELTDLSRPGQTFSGRLRARGMSSGLEGEGDFPKLKVEIGKGVSREGSLFTGDREFRINSHVSTHPRSKHTDMGRLNDERSPYREALAYDWAELLGFPTIAHRRAVIRYTDTGTGEQFERKALLIERDKSFGKRFGAKVLSLDEFAARQETGISLEDSARFHLFQALIGNKDFILRVSQEPTRADNPIWGCGNCLVLEKPSGERLVGPYDFDLATLVAGEEKIQGAWAIYREFGMEDEASSFLAWSITSLRARHPESAVRAALQGFLTRAPVLKATAENAPIDPEGKEVALRHLSRFLSLVEPALSWPVIAEPGIPLYRRATGEESKLHPMPSGEAARLRPGTPVKLLAREGNRLKVAVLDFHWDLGENENSVGYIPASASLTNWVPDAYLAWRDDRDQPEPDSRRRPRR